MVSGIVAPTVASIVVTNVRGKDDRIPIINGTFFFDRGWGQSVIAYDHAGRAIGSYDLEN
jgi:hypothetical protein